MSTANLVTQCYVCLREARALTLSYYLEDIPGKPHRYGVKIVQSELYAPETAEVTAAASVCEDADAVRELITSLARTFTFPESLEEIVQDWQQENAPQKSKRRKASGQ